MSSDRPQRRAVTEGIFDTPLEDLSQSHLRGSYCTTCAETTFGTSVICPKCGGTDLRSLALSDVGTLYTFTVIRHKPPGNYHLKDNFAPFGLGLVELEQGVRIMAPLLGAVEDLRIGMRMRLMPMLLRTDEQKNDVVGFAYKPEN